MPPCLFLIHSLEINIKSLRYNLVGDVRVCVHVYYIREGVREAHIICDLTSYTCVCVCARAYALLIIFNITKLHISVRCFHFTFTKIKTKRFHLAQTRQDTNVSHCKAHAIHSNNRRIKPFRGCQCQLFNLSCLCVCVHSLFDCSSFLRL